MKDEELYFWNGPLPETQAPAPAAAPEPWGETKVVGKPITRIDAYDRVSGSAQYPSDVILPDMLHAAILSCPHAHAMVKKVDAVGGREDARRQGHPEGRRRRHEHPVVLGPRRVLEPPVRHALPLRGRRGRRRGRRHDLPGLGRRARDQGRVRRPAAGHVGRGRDEARRAGRARRRQRDPAGAAIRTRATSRRRFKTADVVLEHTFTTPFELQNPMELHGCVAKWDGPRLTIWESTQGVYGVQTGVARALNIPLANIRVIGHYMGGGFGAKLSHGKYSVMAALLAKKTARPVRLFLTREQVCLSMGNRPGNTITLKAGAKKDGTLVALQSKVVGSGGAYSDGGTGERRLRHPRALRVPERALREPERLHQRRAGAAVPGARAPAGRVGARNHDGRAGREARHGSDRAAPQEHLARQPVAQRQPAVHQHRVRGLPEERRAGVRVGRGAGAQARGVAHQARRRRGRRHVAGRRRQPAVDGHRQALRRRQREPEHGRERHRLRHEDLGRADRGRGTRRADGPHLGRARRHRDDAVRHAERRQQDGAHRIARDPLGSPRREAAALRDGRRAAQAPRRGSRTARRGSGLEDRCHEEGGPRPDPGLRPARPDRRDRLSRAEPAREGDQPVRRAVRRSRGQHEDRRDQGAAVPGGARQRPHHEREDVPGTRCSAASRWASGSASPRIA